MRLGVEAALVEGRLLPGDVAIDDGRIQALGLDGVGRGIAVPGFVDLQVNGFAGVDLMGADADPERGMAVAFAAIDNLVKGAAGQAVQNANLMFGFEETAGLDGLPGSAP